VAIATTAAAVLIALIAPPLLRRRRREQSLRRPLPGHWRELADRAVPLRARWPAEWRSRHEGLIRSFLDEKEFVGCNGLDVSEAARVTIAAQACLLLLGRPGSLYDELLAILLYPTAFWVEDEVHDEDGLVTRRRRALSGEAWDSRRIILSWEDIEESAALPSDGFNLVLHEFAHYLEAEGGGPARDVEAWSADLEAEFERFVDAVERDEETFLDPYAAEDESEFFAVATEEFYERPLDLRGEHPRLYALLGAFYGVDPAAWLSSPG